MKNYEFKVSSSATYRVPGVLGLHGALSQKRVGNIAQFDGALDLAW